MSGEPAGDDGWFYSVRMRAADGAGEHLSGNEHLVRHADLDQTALDLLRRARGSSPDFIQITIDRIAADAVTHIPCLSLTNRAERDPIQARAGAQSMLVEAGCSILAIESAFRGLTNGQGVAGTQLRGATLMDLKTGDRLEPDLSRGVRASHFDYSVVGRTKIDALLSEQNLTHFRTREALAVASKVIWAGVTAELCWSDDPEYVAGYVATERHGYVRFADFKPPGAKGGRVFFVDRGRVSVKDLLERLEKRPVLIE